MLQCITCAGAISQHHPWLSRPENEQITWECH